MITTKNYHLSVRLVALGLLVSTGAMAQLPGSLPKTSVPTSATSIPGASTPGTSASGTSASSMPMASSTVTSSAVATNGAGDSADSAAVHLDKAIAASTNGNKAAAVSALNAGVAAAEQQAASSKGDFSNKLMSQAGNLKKLIPGVQSGLVAGNVLTKAVSLVKMALGANQISSLLGGGGSLIGQAGALTSGLSLLKGGLPSLGGQSAAMGGPLLDGALNSVSKLGGPGGAAAEPMVKQQLGNVLGFAKSIL